VGKLSPDFPFAVLAGPDDGPEDLLDNEEEEALDELLTTLFTVLELGLRLVLLLDSLRVLLDAVADDTEDMAVVGTVLGPEDDIVVLLDDSGDEDVDAPAHAPAIDGTASGPLPIATRLEPQFAACPRWMLELS